MSEATTKRISRKELRAPDEFVTVTGRVVDWATENSRLVGGLGAGLVALMLVAGIWSWVASSRADRASRDFYAADELFRREQWEAAEKGFEALATDLPGTMYGRLARAYAGRAALRGGRPAEATGYLREFLAAPIPDKALEQLAHMNLGSALAEQGKTDEARAELNTALGMDGPAKDEITMELARVEEAAGNKEKALELYQGYLAEDPNAVARDLARARIVALGGTPPAVAGPNIQAGGLPPGFSVQAQ